MDPVDNDVYDEGFQQAYLAFKGNSARLPRGPRKRLILKDRTPLQCGIIGGIAAAIGMLPVDLSDVL